MGTFTPACLPLQARRSRACKARDRRAAWSPYVTTRVVTCGLVHAPRPACERLPVWLVLDGADGAAPSTARDGQWP